MNNPISQSNNGWKTPEQEGRRRTPDHLLIEEKMKTRVAEIIAAMQLSLQPATNDPETARALQERQEDNAATVIPLPQRPPGDTLGKVA